MVLPSRACSARIIERVIDNLKRDAEIEAEGAQRFFFRSGPPGHNRADAAGGGKKLGGLGAHDFEIGLLARRAVVRRRELQDFAFRDHGGCGGENAQHVD